MKMMLQDPRGIVCSIKWSPSCPPSKLRAPSALPTELKGSHRVLQEPQTVLQEQQFFYRKLQFSLFMGSRAPQIKEAALNHQGL